ncbi:MAG: von Willebrand factor type A domain-containing protein, partial [Rubripirellula sp.]|nr:von Willebrand factor type A domain-containing protein [Rubripirellula sp.]
MSNNTWDDPRITAYVLDGLTDEERTQFESDLKNNPELAAATEEARGLTDQLQGIFTAEPVVPLDEERRRKIAAEQLSVTPVHGESSSMKFVWVALAIAACVLLLVGVAPYLNRDRLTPTMTQLSIEQADESVEAAEFETEGFLSAEGAAADGSQTLRDIASTSGSEAPGGMVMEESSVGQDDAFSDFEGGDFDAADSIAAGSVPSSGASVTGSAPPPPAPALAPPAPAAASSARAARRSIDQPGSSANAPESGLVGGAPESVPSATNTRNNQRSRAGEQKERPGRQAKAALGNSPQEAAPSAAAQNAPIGEAAPGDISSPFGNSGVPADRSIREEDGLELSAAPGDQPMGVNSPAAAAEPARDASGGGIGSAAANSRANQPGFRSSGRSEKKDARVGSVYVPSAVVPSNQPDFGSAVDEGRGPGIAGDRFDPITDNAFKRVGEHPFSTLSVDVDTASYSKVRDFLSRGNQLPRPDAVRIEELLNYFDYDYTPPSDDAEHPFAVHTVVTGCPWNSDHRLARIALQGKTMQKDERPPCNLVFLLDTSGSMNSPNKLPLVVEGMKMLVDQLGENDTVAIAVYAGSAGLVLDSTEATKQKQIRKALTQLNAGGSTNGGAGIALAYQTARDHFVDEGVNRVILCTDGDFNVGTTGTDS